MIRLQTYHLEQELKLQGTVGGKTIVDLHVCICAYRAKKMYVLTELK